jgi:hypothetical protein
MELKCLGDDSEYDYEFIKWVRQELNPSVTSELPKDVDVQQLYLQRGGKHESELFFLST